MTFLTFQNLFIKKKKNLTKAMNANTFNDPSAKLYFYFILFCASSYELFDNQKYS